MIFYFSGTGNSLYAARKVANILGEGILSIADEMRKNHSVFEYELKKDEILGFVFPVYAWAPPKIVLDFVKRLKVSETKPYTFSLCTCGAEEGKATRMLQKTLFQRGLLLQSAFSVVMPNNYMIGVELDSQEVVIKKLQDAEAKLQAITDVIRKRQSLFDIIPGKWSALKSAVVNPMFNRFAMNTKQFYATDKCTGCGTCEKVCPVNCIVVRKKPAWNKTCTHCLACINRCPVHAIQHAKRTIHKARYLHPDLKD